VSYPDQNGEIQQDGEDVDCSRHTNKELSYDSRKELRKFSSLVPKIEGKYNVTVSLENIKPVILEFSVTRIECDEGFKDVDGVEDSIAGIFQQTANCNQPASIWIGNNTKQIIDVACLQLIPNDNSVITDNGIDTTSP